MAVLSTALASPVAWRPGPVDPQFLGQARAFRDRLKAVSTECSRLIDEIAMPLVRRSRRHPIPRREQLIDVARKWSCMPSLGLLDTTTELDLRKRVLRISQLRVCPSDFRAANWAVGETGVSVLGLKLDAEPYCFSFVMPSLVTVSLHALGRRYQRAVAVTDEAIFADLHTLARAHPRLTAGDVGAAFEVNASGGCWHGNITDAATSAGTDRILSVRTFTV
jgi:hypothetical protein